MWLRFAAISSLKWIANILAIILLSTYVIPGSWSGYVRAIPLWFLSFVVAFVFAEWALYWVHPGRLEIIRLLSAWLVLSLSYQVLYGYISLGNVYSVIYSFDIYAQFILEVCAVLLAAYALRRHKILSLLDEGLAE